MRKIRDPELLDRLQSLKPKTFAGSIWRMARAGRSPLLATQPKGRWDDGTFGVLYAALGADAARAEVFYHLARGQPVFPSALQIHLQEVQANLERVLVFDTLETLVPFGIDGSKYGSSDDAKLQAEYSVTQQIGEAAHFLGMHALVVPSARWPAQNIVVLLQEGVRHVQDFGPQDLKTWARQHIK
jgi:RES domain